LFQYIFISLFFLFSAVGFSEQMLRVNIGRSNVPVHMTGKTLIIKNESGETLSQTNSATFTPTQTGISLAGKNIGKKIFITSKEPMQVFGRTYLDENEILWQKSSDNKPEIIIIHPVSLERYLISTVASEMSSSWHEEALKAQAITARTYALWQKFRRIHEPYHVSSTVNDQVYNGIGHNHPNTQKAVEATNGQVITFESELIEAYFSSTCGGYTESSKEGWGKFLAYLPVTRCTYCQSSPTYTWKTTFTQQELKNALKSVTKQPITGITIREKTDSGRIKTIDIKTKKSSQQITGSKLRNLLGNAKLKSTFVTNIDFNSRTVTFSGKGFGHGVGMCQYGALGMAKAGKSANDIIQFYFPGTEIRAMY